MNALRDRVLHEAGFRCGNPACRAPLTLDAHHLAPACAGAATAAEDLLCLCAGCHAMLAGGAFTRDTLRVWKQASHSLVAGFGRDAPDTLLLLKVVEDLAVSGDGLMRCSGLVTSGLLEIRARISGVVSGQGGDIFKLRLSARGRAFVDAWISGHQDPPTSL